MSDEFDKYLDEVAPVQASADTAQPQGGDSFDAYLNQVAPVEPQTPAEQQDPNAQMNVFAQILPKLEAAGQAVGNTVAGASQESHQDPLGAAASLIGGAGEGIVGLGQDIGNFGTRALFGDNAHQARWKQDYDAVMQNLLGEHYQPNASAIGQFAGPAAIPLGDAAAGANVAKSALQGAGIGGVMGAIQAGGNQDSGPLDAKATAEAALQNALIGALLGGGAAKLGQGGKTLAKEAPTAQPPADVPLIGMQQGAPTPNVIELPSRELQLGKQAPGPAVPREPLLLEMNKNGNPILLPDRQALAEIERAKLGKQAPGHEYATRGPSPVDEKYWQSKVEGKVLEKKPELVKETPAEDTRQVATQEPPKTPEPTPYDEELARYDYEKTHFPLSDKEFSDMRGGEGRDHWTPRMLSDRQLQAEIRDAQIKLDMKSTNRYQKGKAKEALEAYQQEDLRREQRRAEGLKTDWPQESKEAPNIERSDYFSKAEPLPENLHQHVGTAADAWLHAEQTRADFDMAAREILHDNLPTRMQLPEDLTNDLRKAAEEAGGRPILAGSNFARIMHKEPLAGRAIPAAYKTDAQKVEYTLGLADQLKAAEAESKKAVTALKGPISDTTGGTGDTQYWSFKHKGRDMALAWRRELRYKDPDLKGLAYQFDDAERKTQFTQYANKLRESEGVPVTDFDKAKQFLKDFFTREEGSAELSADWSKVFGAIQETGKVAKEARGAVTAPMKLLKTTFDLVKDQNPELEQLMWRNVAKEALAGRGVKFDKSQAGAVQELLGATPGEIRGIQHGLYVKNAPAAATANFTPEQLKFLEQRAVIRQESAAAVQKEMGKMTKLIESEGRNRFTADERDRYDGLKHLYNGLTGQRETSGTAEVERMLDPFNSAMYDYIFKWNPGYHGLNRLDPWIVGSSKLGVHNIIKGTAIQRDKVVHKYISDLADGLLGPADQIKLEMGVARREPLPGDASVVRKGLEKVQKVHDKMASLPDLPSVKWNNRDTVAAALIKHGDDIKYKGGGTQLLKDLAHGKLGQEAEMDAVVQALRANQDINGSGSFGLSKDIVGRTVIARRFIQFVSQPLRVSRLMTHYAKQIATPGQRVAGITSMATFLAAQQQLGGRAAIPIEVRDAWRAADKDSERAFEDILDATSAMKHVPIVGRDLTDKLSYSILPLVGGSMGNVGYEQIQKIVSNAVSGKTGSAAQMAAWSAVNHVLGGGGATAKRVADNVSAAMEGEKTYYVHPEQDLVTRDEMQGKFTDDNYTPAKAFLNTALPGMSIGVGNRTKEVRREKEDRQRS